MILQPLVDPLQATASKKPGCTVGVARIRISRLGSFGQNDILFWLSEGFGRARLGFVWRDRTHRVAPARVRSAESDSRFTPCCADHAVSQTRNLVHGLF
jgi:hypothetical protein